MQACPEHTHRFLHSLRDILRRQERHGCHRSKQGAEMRHSADRLTANRWRSGSVFAGQVKGLTIGCEVSPQAGFARCLLLGAVGLSGSRERQADLRIYHNAHSAPATTHGRQSRSRRSTALGMQVAVPNNTQFKHHQTQGCSATQHLHLQK